MEREERESKIYKILLASSKILVTDTFRADHFSCWAVGASMPLPVVMTFLHEKKKKEKHENNWWKKEKKAKKGQWIKKEGLMIWKHALLYGVIWVCLHFCSLSLQTTLPKVHAQTVVPFWTEVLLCTGTFAPCTVVVKVSADHGDSFFIQNTLPQFDTRGEKNDGMIKKKYSSFICILNLWYESWWSDLDSSISINKQGL
jgi:hypothetical protein